jgi:hypothetical protein
MLKSQDSCQARLQPCLNRSLDLPSRAEQHDSPCESCCGVKERASGFAKRANHPNPAPNGAAESSPRRQPWEMQQKTPRTRGRRPSGFERASQSAEKLDCERVLGRARVHKPALSEVEEPASGFAKRANHPNPAPNGATKSSPRRQPWVCSGKHIAREAEGRAALKGRHSLRKNSIASVFWEGRVHKPALNEVEGCQ